METVERRVTLPADLDQAWELLTEPDELAGWLGRDVVFEPLPGATGSVVEHDGTHRLLVIDEVEVGRRLAWHWWVEGDDETSRVEITLTPADEGTEVHVIETLPSGSTPASTIRASACASEAWSHRLLHLEALLLVAAAVRG
jgi:uncharacterized protein YndB with AHSA1/START domain